MTFPDNRMLIIICVAIYGVCSLITSGVIFFMEGSAFYAGTVPPKARKTTKKDFTPSVWARSQLGQKGSSTYVLHLHARARGAFTSEMKHGYEKYFTTEGRFLQAPFRADLGATLGSFNSKKDK